MLTAWLTAQPRIALNPDGIARHADHVSIDPHRLDDTLATELRRHPGRLTTAAELRAALHAAELRAALQAAGYSAAGVRALLYMSPLPHRIPGRPGFYQLRGVSV